METHERRLQMLADAMGGRPDEVVATLRRRNVTYLGSGGVVLLACGGDWPDERLVKAAVDLFIHQPGEHVI